MNKRTTTRSIPASLPAVALGVGQLQPLERPVGLPEADIHLGNLEGPGRMVLRDKLRQRCVRFLLVQGSWKNDALKTGRSIAM